MVLELAVAARCNAIVTHNVQDFEGLERFGLEVYTPGAFLALLGEPSLSTLSLRLPSSLHKQVRELARQEGVSINQLITTALAEKMSALMTVEYLQERAARGSRERFEAVLAKIPDVEPEDYDRLPRDQELPPSHAAAPAAAKRRR